MNTIINSDTYHKLETKVLSIHSSDRDESKWPFAYEFEIELPQEYYNIQTIRVLDFTYSNIDYVFSDKNKNTKMTFTLDLNLLSRHSSFTIQIDEGNYDGNQIANELQYKMNKVVTEFLNKETNREFDENYLGFVVVFNEVQNKIYFGNNNHDFTLLFVKDEEYKLHCDATINNNRNINNYLRNEYSKNKKGLYYYLGYEKKNYNSELYSESQVFGYNGLVWLIPKNEECFISRSINTLQLYGESTMYVEIDKFNNSDELIESPEFKFSSSLSDPNTSVFKNTYGGKVDSYFCKVNLYNKYQNKSIYPTFENVNGSLINVSKTYSPVLENLKKIKFKFRYHDGTYVNFSNNDINLSIELNCIRNEMNKFSNAQKPSFIM